MKLIPTLLLLCSLGCSRPSGSLSDVRLGMSQDEVVRLLGEPAERQHARCGRGSPSIFVYEGTLTGPAAERSAVTFIDGRVTHVVRRGKGILAPPQQIADCSTAGRDRQDPARSGTR